MIFSVYNSILRTVTVVFFLYVLGAQMERDGVLNTPFLSVYGILLLFGAVYPIFKKFANDLKKPEEVRLNDNSN